MINQAAVEGFDSDGFKKVFRLEKLSTGAWAASKAVHSLSGIKITKGSFKSFSQVIAFFCGMSESKLFEQMRSQLK